MRTLDLHGGIKVTMKKKTRVLWVAEKLKELRIRRGLTLQQVATRIGHDSHSRISDYESAKYAPGLVNMFALFDALGTRRTTSSVTCQTSKRLASQPVRLVARVKQKGEPDVTRPVINSCYSISIAGMSAMHSAARFGQRFVSSP